MTNTNKPIADFDALKKVRAPEVDPSSSRTVWPDRPTVYAKPPDLQISIKGPAPVMEEFKALCADDRRAYWEMLEILMRHFKNK